MGRRLNLKIMTARAVVGLSLAAGMAATGQDNPPAPTPADVSKGRAAPARSGLGPGLGGGTKLALIDVSAGLSEPAAAAAAPVPKPGRDVPTTSPPEEPTPTPRPAVEPSPTPAAPMSAPAALPPVEMAPAAQPAPLDELVVPAEAHEPARGKPAAGKSPSAAAKSGDGGAKADDAETSGRPADSSASTAHNSSGTHDDKRAFVLPAERLSMGRQGVGLSVEVVAPPAMNLHQTTSLKVVVKNTGTTDAIGVVVRDELPETLEFLSSQPEAQRIDALLSWQLGTVPAGSERVITLSVKPLKVGSFDHAATVALLAGGKSRTLVREPKLKVEQTATSGKVLRGQPVQFKIVVSNPGDGPVKNVTVQAKLSPGLRHESGEPNDQNLFEQTIEQIGPGERVPLDTLVADTLQSGEQSCLVVAQSPDVPAGGTDARSIHTITVVEPRLQVKLSGPEKRYTDTLASYELVLENTGTAPARTVRAQVTLPLSGRLYQLPPGAQFNTQTRRLSWVRPLLDPGEKATLSFQVRMGGVGIYAVAAEVKADGVGLEKDLFQTDVEGLADVNFEVTEKRRVVDVDGETVFAIKVVNSGSKAATGLLLKAVMSNNIEPLVTSNGDVDAQARWNQVDTLIFPQIPRLDPGKALELQIKVKATKSGIATCRVYLEHDDLKEKLDDVAAFKVTATRR